MPSLATRLRRKLRAGHRRYRELLMIAKGLLSTDHIVQAHIIPMRRCNLSCAYCNEYDDVSKPVDLDIMLGRVDHLAKLGATLIMISGGEPLLHPELEKIVARIHHHGRIAGMITNGYLLMPDRIHQLNAAGLDHLQISIDNVMPDEVSKKSLKVLDKKLQMLAEHSDFHVNINSVLGGGTKNPDDALTIGRRALELGFSCTVGIIHDGHGQLKPLGDPEMKVYRQFKTLAQRSFAHFSGFQDKVALGQPIEWRCRAGSRYIYVCEDGLVHYCSQQRGYPGIPLLKYTTEDVKREYLTKKDCAPMCTISCVHMTSHMDFWRSPQTLESGLNQPKPEVEDLINIQGVGR